jgi:hypothetical protein
LRGAAAAGDPDLADLVATADRERLVGTGGFVRHLGDAGVLRPGLTVEHGVDVVWTLLAPEVFRALAAGRGWSYDDIERFLTGQLVAALLGE